LVAAVRIVSVRRADGESGVPAGIAAAEDVLAG
jgi:hypothetical protein